MPERMSQATDDTSGWLNKDTFLSNVRLMASRSKPAITLSQGERQAGEKFACWNLRVCFGPTLAVDLAAVQKSQLALITL